MDITTSRGLRIAATTALVFGFGFMGVSAANATETPTPTPTVSNTPPDPTASLNCTAFSEGVNSATATGTLTMDPALEQVTVKFEVDTADGSYVGTEDLTSTGKYSITVPNILPTTQAQLTLTAVYVFNQDTINVKHTGTCATDASVTISGPAVTPTPTPTPITTTPPTPTPTPTPITTTPPASSGSTTIPPATITAPKVGHPAGAGTDGFDLVRAQQASANAIVDWSVGGSALLVILLSTVYFLRKSRKASGAAQ